MPRHQRPGRTHYDGPRPVPDDNRGGCSSSPIGSSVIPSGGDTLGASVTLEPGMLVNGAGERLRE